MTQGIANFSAAPRILQFNATDKEIDVSTLPFETNVSLIRAC